MRLRSVFTIGTLRNCFYSLEKIPKFKETAQTLLLLVTKIFSLFYTKIIMIFIYFDRLTCEQDIVI